MKKYFCGAHLVPLPSHGRHGLVSSTVSRVLLPLCGDGNNRRRRRVMVVMWWPMMMVVVVVKWKLAINNKRKISKKVKLGGKTWAEGMPTEREKRAVMAHSSLVINKKDKRRPKGRAWQGL